MVDFDLIISTRDGRTFSTTLPAQDLPSAQKTIRLRLANYAEKNVAFFLAENKEETIIVPMANLACVVVKIHEEEVADE